jgi:hypothetical protein
LISFGSKKWCWSPFRAMRHFADNAEHNKAFEQSRRVLRRHTERRAERGGGDQRSRGEDVLSCPFYVVTPKSRRET